VIAVGDRVGLAPVSLTAVGMGGSAFRIEPNRLIGDRHELALAAVRVTAISGSRIARKYAAACGDHLAGHPYAHALRSSAAGGSNRDGGQRGGRHLIVVEIQQLAGHTDGLRTALRESYLQFKDYRW
jgi:integrase